MDSALTAKQYEVAMLLAEHMTSKEIASHLGLSQSAVNQRIAAAMRRLRATSRRHVARLMKDHVSRLREQATTE